jgi:hypothetical protein
MRRPSAIVLFLAAGACARASGPAAPAPAGAPEAARPASTATADPGTLRYGAGTSRYRIETQQHVVQEVMGNTQTIDGTTMQLLSITLAPRGDSLDLTVTVDSMSVTTSAPGGEAVAATAARAMMGRRFTGTLASNGSVASITSPDSATREVAQAMQGLRQFLPVLPAGPLTAGREWTDTVSTNQALETLTMTTRAVRTHRVVGWEQREGVRALRLTTQSVYTVTGSGEAQGAGPLELAGSGTANTDQFLSAAGIYLGATESDSAQINVNVVSMGMSIPVTRSQRATVTRVP